MSTTLLLIEDSEAEREGVAALLRVCGFEVMSASSADEGIGLADQHTPDLILLDMMMRSGSDGWKFLERRRMYGKLQTVPIVIMTGLQVASEVWAKALGADGLLRKPVNVDEMLKTIRDHLAAHPAP
jgi:twitching motility two-component system response regulator PilH